MADAYGEAEGYALGLEARGFVAEAALIRDLAKTRKEIISEAVEVIQKERTDWLTEGLKSEALALNFAARAVEKLCHPAPR